MKPGVPLYHVDAFTDRPFAGNPAAVCLLDDAPPERWMADVAAEMNLAETAFCWPEDHGFRLRWFTPKVEVDLCGHATLATAHVLWRERGVADTGPLTFLTASGELRAETAGERIRLDFPATPAGPAEPAAVAAAGAALGSSVADAAVYGPNLLVEVAGPAELRGLTPNIAAVADLPFQGVIVTSSGDGADYVMRYFAPNVGIDEDPTTGSAQCAAGPFWRARTGRSTFEVEQASVRTGRLWVEVGDERIGIAGCAVTVVGGMITAPWR
ncbi:MAG: PhzF family phenazine biosynthesis protein [Actinomycetota bacterium]|nr:PhzF family phenazine biosynthesis protein [Actinomycetota bacterium]